MATTGELLYYTSTPSVQPPNGQWVDNQGHGLPTTLGTLLAGEDQTNNRMLTEMSPVAADSILETLQNAAGATGVGTAINVKGYKSVVLDVTGITTATVTFQGTVDDSNWVTIGLAAVATGTVAGTATANGMFYVPTALLALSQIRANITAWTSGAITVKSRKTPR